jgi:NTP pyrophosphatase (non-canonical NTP hydrolase)
MKLNEYQIRAMETRLPSSKNVEYMLLGLLSEAGEVAGVLKKYIRGDNGQPVDTDIDDKTRINMAKELGDVAWYLAVTAHLIGYDLESIFEMNINKLMERYPDGFDPARSLHRQKGDI